MSTTHTTTAFGALLRYYRSRASLSQEMLAERAGLSAAAIAALESGRRTAPRPDTIALLADALELTPSERRELATVGLAPAHGEPARAAMPASLSRRPPLSLPPLPTPPTALIGREQEIAALAQLLSAEGRSRLVTLTGPGGVGKTRLALAAATAVADAYSDGIAFVDLSALRDPDLIAPTIAQALGLRDEGTRDARALLPAALDARKLLLILDNVEQVVEGAPLLTDLAALCPLLTMLVTSRIALQVRAEQRFVVAPLPVPAPDHASLDAVEGCAAVRLFVARARAVQADFTLLAATAEVVAEICRRLDGLPLAIELAAARIGILPPAELLRRLERRLGLLTRGARDVPMRQQTLHATIEWSHALLPPAAQTLFRRIGVFSGGATLEAIAAVCATPEAADVGSDVAADVLDGVASLVDNSLLSTEPGVEPRVGLLETVREYARERLDAAGETGRLQQAHAAYYLALAEAAEPELRGAEQSLWLQRLAREQDNLRAALDWALQSGAVALGLRLGGALWRFWYLQGQIREGRSWLARLLACEDGEQAERADVALARAKVLGGTGVFAELQGDYPRARQLHEESLALRQRHGDRWGVADSLDDLGVVADSQGDLAGAAEFYAQALAQFRELGDAWGTALVLGNQGYLAREQGAYAEAAALHEQSLALFRAVGDQRNIAFTLNNLGEVLCDQGTYGRAGDLCMESLALRRALGDTWGVAISSATLGRVAQAEGAYDLAVARYEESVGLFRQLGATWNTACALDSLSSVACQQGAYQHAAELSAESLALFEAIHDTKGTARALTTAAQVAYAQGDLVSAERLCRESLALSQSTGGLVGGVAGLECLAQVLCTPIDGPAAAVRMERGIELWAAMTALREARGTPRPPFDQAAYEHALKAAQAVLDAQTIAAAWTRGQDLSLEQAMAEALAPDG